MSQPTLFGSGFLKKKTSETTGEELTNIIQFIRINHLVDRI